MRYFGGMMLCAVMLTGCADGYVSFPVSEQQQQSLPQDVEVIRLTRDNIADYTRPQVAPKTDFVSEAQVWNYKVGVGDVLNIEVFDHPELRLPPAEGNSEAESGFRVQANGTFYFPYIGELRAMGRTPDIIREDLTDKLSEYIPAPQVQVRVAGFNSQTAIVSGDVNTPNTQKLKSTPLTVLAAVNAAGGVTDEGDLSRVKLQRGGRSYNINLELFLSGSGARYNPIVLSGDVISVSRRLSEEAYILGQVAKPATIDLSREPVNLTQALTRQGGLDERRADAQGVFVFRNSGQGVKVFQLEASSPTGLLLGTEFLLSSNDVVYVTRAPISKWNDTITQLLPSISVAGAVDDFGG